MGVTVMFLVALALGPLQPLADTLRVAVPEKAAGNVIALPAPVPLTAEPFNVQL